MKKLLLIIILLITSCAKPPIDTSILEQSSCELPCWNNIVAGQTTEKEALQILEDLPIVDQASIENTNQHWNMFDNQVYFSFKQDRTLNQPPQIRGSMDITDNIVSGLILCGEINTSMGDIVAATGEPDGILGGGNIDGSRIVILINSQKGLSYWYTFKKTPESQRYEITPYTPVNCINLFDPRLYEKLLDATLLSDGHYNAEETLKVMYPWDGYGDLDEKYPLRQP